MKLQLGQCWEYSEPNYTAKFIIEELGISDPSVTLKCYCLVNKNGFTDDFKIGHIYVFLKSSLNDETKWQLRFNPVKENIVGQLFDKSLN